ncbi:hypothetical protein RRG08_039310, partial [Elysia crispata]
MSVWDSSPHTKRFDPLLENQQVFLSDVTDRSEKIHRQFLLTETKGPEQPHVETFKPQEKIKSDAQKQNHFKEEKKTGCRMIRAKENPPKARRQKVDGPKLRHITMEEALRRFQYKASSECVNKCPQATDDDSDLSYSSMCNFTAQARWTNALQQNGAEVMPFVDDDVYVYPYERKYLSYPKLPDSSYLPSARKSRVVLTAGVMRGKTSTATCRLGGSATARLDLVDEAGRPRTLGGDEV